MTFVGKIFNENPRFGYIPFCFLIILSLSRGLGVQSKFPNVPVWYYAEILASIFWNKKVLPLYICLFVVLFLQHLHLASVHYIDSQWSLLFPSKTITKYWVRGVRRSIHLMTRISRRIVSNCKAFLLCVSGCVS